jgi:sugar lactone lactonase YvrE
MAEPKVPPEEADGIVAAPRGGSRWLAISATLALLLGTYLLLAPVPISPVAWEAPSNPGYTGVFEANERLSAMELVPIGEDAGPEAIARDAEGRLYLATLSGWIVRLDSTGRNPVRWANTGGRPLGLAFDSAGTLWVADGRRGLLCVLPSGAVLVMATEAAGRPIRFADDLDVAPDGRVYLTDASTKFHWPRFDPLQASILEMLEHRGTGRVLEYDPATGETSELAAGLVFPNGITLTHDASALLVNETGNYRVLRIERAGVARGAMEAVVTDLPGFPDNLKRGRDGRYWMALVSPRSALADWLSDKPSLRKLLLRLPASLRPGPKDYGHIVAFDSTWRVVADLQDPSGKLPALTSVLETDGSLWLGSLKAPSAARLKWMSR